ncbi:6696_t:CDS:2, partial [Funneliformis geosporum]
AYDNGNGISKEEYWSRIVNISMEVIERLRDKIVEDVLKEIINDILQIDLNGMIKTAVWKPDKNNKKPGKRFEYIVIKNDSSQRVGDKMEYPEVVRRLGKKIDISYYLKTIVGLCARFINYDESFQQSYEIVLRALKI